MWVDVTHEPICIPANSVKVVKGKTDKITRCLTCMVESRGIHNLPMGFMVNRAMITPKKSKKVPVILANTNSYNIWIKQPLLAANVVEVESCPWDYQTILSRDGKDIKVSFCPVPPPEVQEDVFISGPSVMIENDHDMLKISRIQARNQSLVLGLIIVVQGSIFRRNWIDFLSR